MTRILMVAAENDALPGAKVGGIGDVVRDIAPALAGRGCQVTVLMPSYGMFAGLAQAHRSGSLRVNFGGAGHEVGLYEVGGASGREAGNEEKAGGVRHMVLDHSLFSACGRGRIYCDDPPERPFATDASKFAFFCAAVAEGMVRGAFGAVDVLHLHDWHAAFVLILRRFHPAFQSLQNIRCAFTIHNLALQGIRPFAGDRSSLAAWYPGLAYEHALLADPRWPECFNPMAVGIRLADAVHAVSPSYAQEILRPSAVASHGYFGGEGLDADLRAAAAAGRLHGILNGCEYPEQPASATPDWEELLQLMRSEVLQWSAREAALASVHFIAQARLGALNAQRPGIVLTSVGRITEQKMKLLLQTTSEGVPALEQVLAALGTRGILLLLGSGDVRYEQYLTQTAARFANFIFLRGYSDALARALYRCGDLFVMPSSFEPCGISQMLALRDGQPCLVHDVGGLKDTVQDGVTGFSFSGDNLTSQADQLVRVFQRALLVHEKHPRQWQAMREAAAAKRFRWADSIDVYLERLYERPLPQALP